MKLTHLLTIHAILALGFGIAFALYAPLMIAFFGVPELPEGNILLYWNVASFARMFGAALFGLGILLWAIRGLVENRKTPPEAVRGVIFALLIANAMSVFVAATQQMAVWLSPAGWMAIVIFAILSLAYIYFLVSIQGGSEISKRTT